MTFVSLPAPLTTSCPAATAPLHSSVLVAATSVWHLLTMRAEALAAQAATGNNVAGQQVGPWLHVVGISPAAAVVPQVQIIILSAARCRSLPLLDTAFVVTLSAGLRPAEPAVVHQSLASGGGQGQPLPQLRPARPPGVRWRKLFAMCCPARAVAQLFRRCLSSSTASTLTL